MKRSRMTAVAPPLSCALNRVTTAAVKSTRATLGSVGERRSPEAR